MPVQGRRTSQRNRTDPVPTYSVTWTYDAAGRMLTRTADGTVTSYSYDASGNRTCAGTGAVCSTAADRVTAVYDRLGRVLSVDDNADGTADTTYTYSLTSPSWTDPTGSYTAALDRAGRPTAETTPAAGSWAFTYGATGQVTGTTAGNGNTIAITFDATGRELTRITKTGATTRASYTWTFNRAGLILSEASAITGDASNGTVTYGYDALGRLTSNGATATTWDAAANRTGQGSSTTTFDAANRPTSGTGPTATYTSDADGRLTARPGQTLVWDHLGRLATVTTTAGTTAYTYDPLDRLHTVSSPGGAVTRFRYTGLTASAAVWIDDTTGTVTRSLANGWGGEHLADWDPAVGVSSLRVYGTNAHHDVTWLADSTGSVISSLRYDPWGVPRSTPPASYTPFRFQGSWTDTNTDLLWVVTRWYAPSLGTFLSEDSLLGDQRDPGSRHLYAYGQGAPVGSWDPDGRTTISSTVIPFARAMTRYYKVRDYIFGEMKRNAAGSRFGYWRESDAPFGCLFGSAIACLTDHNARVLEQFGLLERGSYFGLPPGDWDHKPKLKALVLEDHVFYTPIAGDTTPERLRFDVWSNIHYGYVGRSHGIPAGILRMAANSPLGGGNSLADRLSVDLGIRLWGKYGLDLQVSNLQDIVLRHMQMYRTSPNAVKRGWY